MGDIYYLVYEVTKFIAAGGTTEDPKAGLLFFPIPVYGLIRIDVEIG